jgi:predicted Zn-dependent protease
MKKDNFDVKMIEVQKLHANQQYQKAKECIEKIIHEDCYYLQVMPLYCAVLIELNQKKDLYYIAHKLASNDPDSAIAWFAVVSEISTISLGLPLLPDQEV